MIEALIGKKIGMTHLFADEGLMVPVTVLEVGPCLVTQLRTGPKDGYEAVQLGYGTAKRLNQPQRGHLKHSGPVKHLREVAASDISEYQIGQSLDVSVFQEGEMVDVIGTSKGKGFQGGMKRHNFSGGPKTHGQKDRGRAVGSIGATTYPGRVLKGQKMPGQMGNKRITVRHMKVQKIDLERNLLMLNGAVPGARNGLVVVRRSAGVTSQGDGQ